MATKPKPTSKKPAAKKTPKKRGTAPKVVKPAKPMTAEDTERLAALRHFIPAISAIFGINPADLVGRVLHHGPRAMAVGALRKLALGAVACLGRDLEISWRVLIDSGVASNAGDKSVHRTSIQSFSLQFGAWTGLDMDGEGTQGEPAGEMAAFARDRYRQIKSDAVRWMAGQRKAAA